MTPTNTPGPWTLHDDTTFSNLGDQRVVGANRISPAIVFGGIEECKANALLIVTACNACMAAAPSHPITVAECIPELIKLARLVSTRPDWQQSFDDKALSNSLHKLLSCIDGVGK